MTTFHKKWMDVKVGVDTKKCPHCSYKFLHGHHDLGVILINTKDNQKGGPSALMCPNCWVRWDAKTGEVQLHSALTPVIMESPFAGNTAAIATRNLKYARRALRDCLRRGEAPLASHLLYTQPGVLADDDPEERRLGIAAGHALLSCVERIVVYEDHGRSAGMKQGITLAMQHGLTIEYRKIIKKRS